MRILAIQLNQPGDAVLTTPALQWLMEQGHDVHALLQPLGAELLQGMPGLASAEALPRDSFQIGRDVRRALRYRRARFDRAIVFSKCSDRPALWAALSGAKERLGLWTPRNQHVGRIGFINHWVRDHALGTHTVCQHLFLAGAPPEAAMQARLVYHPPEADQTWAAEWMRQRDLKTGGYLLLHTGSRWPSKSWPLENWAGFIRDARKKLSLPLLLTCGRDSRETEFTRRLVQTAAGDHTEIGTLSVNQLGALLQNAAGFLGVDSMPMHLAAALGKPGLALFGPTDEKTWGPWKSRLTVVRTPCGCLHAQHTCLKNASRCLAELSPATVLEKMAQALQTST
ncbi:MAG TPA: glycosyltransferase family 9 protein [Candidatus Methylacidiphilales bacterium]|nr:glycosyltransferase family 9 protein [Candidatus Methylacidiphilales bacterium]